MVSSIPQILVAGLGNISHPLTRHSLGQLIVDALAKELGITLSPSSGGFIGRGDVNIGTTFASVTLFKSKSPMNVSGPSIATALRKSLAAPPSSLVVIHDSLSHRQCALSVRLGGSANGHNGVKSVIAALGGDANFYRFRVGIGRSDECEVSQYVLGKVSRHEKEHWGTAGGVGLQQVLWEIEKVLKASSV